MSARELVVGIYDLSLLDELSQDFWRKFAEEGDLPELPSKGKIKIFWRKFETGVSDFPEMKAHAVLTDDGRIINLQDYNKMQNDNSSQKNGEIEI